MPHDAGDLVWAEFSPNRGTERSGRRPALILTPLAYNIAAGRSIVCPVSTTRGDWNWNLPLPDHLLTRGVVLIDQIRFVHNESRLFGFLERVPDSFMADVRARLAPLLGLVP
ncbi:type II toxin-antitoxin system PemK/MazF family toxin [Kaistia dalseonensis]|uniref:mRNA interferase MazF n=1 Tax=Kaistia dalseonensis TaxID=410840 RepID=A0ABU0HBS3_9HYPH|nr:type II toxin-antitoxin system PemK/MazF family toxin [Kaistia dalseonensis]MCX5497084.1 type II toxin-antitoxin system PemK/MazF family toxin [Kaistia dalseonensis]MDQ0439710.1 mRNA interferase MazF [Kaistia dalseonensis]